MRNPGEPDDTRGPTYADAWPSPSGAHDALYEAKALYLDLLSSRPAGVCRIRVKAEGNWVADCASLFTYEFVNDRYCEITGITREALLADASITLRQIHPEDYDGFVVRNKDARLTGEPFLWEGRMIVRGETRRVRFDSKPRRLANGDTLWTGILLDITESVAMEEALRRSEQRLARAQAIAHVGDWEWDVQNNAVDWSDELYRIYGFEPRTVVPDYGLVLAQMHPASKGEFQEAIEAALTGDRPFELDYRFFRKDGTEGVLHTIGQVIRDANGSPVRMVGVVQDVTARKQAEERILKNELFIRNILDAVDEGFIVVDRDYRILTANRAYCVQAGMRSEDVVGKQCHEISHRSHRPCYEDGVACAVKRVFETRMPATDTHRHSGAENALTYVETKAFPLMDADGHVFAAIETLNNITERHLLEEERLKSQKLESIGTLAGGIAHDFNNLLQGVFGYISMAKMSIDKKEKALGMLDQAERALHLSVNLTSQLLTFSKGGKPLKQRVSLGPVIDSAARFALSGSRSDYAIDIGPGLWQAEADAGQIGQVIQNVVLNADQAMPMGGRIEVSARNLPASDAAAHLGLDPRDYVEVRIQDQGIGIQGKYLDKIFDPYFTTKEKGSGLGLATSYSIIRNHGGRIEVQSEVGTGSTFFIYLPASPAAGEGRTEPAPPVGRRSGRILVMDDEEMVRTVAGELLEMVGHEVEYSEHGASAIEKYQAARDAGRPFDAVILDLTIRGGMGGAETMRRLLEIDPGVKAIVSSGYSDDAVVSNYRDHGFVASLKKPYDLACLRSVLDTLIA